MFIILIYFFIGVFICYQCIIFREYFKVISGYYAYSQDPQ